MKKLLLLIAIAFMFSCSEDEVTELKTETIRYERNDFIEIDMLYDFEYYNLIPEDKFKNKNVIKTETEFYIRDDYFIKGDSQSYPVTKDYGYTIHEYYNSSRIYYKIYSDFSSSINEAPNFEFLYANVTFYYTE